MSATVTVLSGPAVRDLRMRVFRERELTLSEAAAPYTLQDWEATTRAFRSQMRAVLQTLPERAFQPQPEVDGNAVWSAGQVLGHVLAAQVDIFGKDIRVIARTPVDYNATSLAGLPDDAHRSRAETLATLDRADEDFAKLVSNLPAGIDLTVAAENQYFGTASLGALLLMIAIHDEDHLGQLNELR